MGDVDGRNIERFLFLFFRFINIIISSTATTMIDDGDDEDWVVIVDGREREKSGIHVIGIMMIEGVDFFSLFFSSFGVRVSSRKSTDSTLSIISTNNKRDRHWNRIESIPPLHSFFFKLQTENVYCCNSDSLWSPGIPLSLCPVSIANDWTM